VAFVVGWSSATRVQRQSVKWSWCVDRFPRRPRPPTAAGDLPDSPCNLSLYLIPTIKVKVEVVVVVRHPISNVRWQVGFHWQRTTCSLRAACHHYLWVIFFLATYVELVAMKKTRKAARFRQHKLASRSATSGAQFLSLRLQRTPGANSDIHETP
jgi:hypothetical protein